MVFVSILHHWCKMDTKTIKMMTKSFYEPWNQVDHVTKFAQRLDDQDYFNHLDDHWCKMDTKTIKMMTTSFYEPWNQVDHVTNFAQRLDEQQVYLNGHDGIDITDATKL